MKQHNTTHTHFNLNGSLILLQIQHVQDKPLTEMALTDQIAKTSCVCT